MNQLSIDFNPDITQAFSTCVEFVHHRVHSIGRQHKAIAADMDLSPSHLSRKLTQSPHDSMRLTVDDLERYIETTGDIEPIKYLVAKHIYQGQTAEVLMRQIEELELQLQQQQFRQVK